MGCCSNRPNHDQQQQIDCQNLNEKKEGNLKEKQQQDSLEQTNTNNQQPEIRVLSQSSDSDNDDYVDEEELKKKQNKEKPRSSVSAEVFGQYNKKGDFQPKVIQKSSIQKQRILERLNQAFMFSALDQQEKDIVINAMIEKRYKPEDWVIKQGEQGDNLYVVEKGELKCFKRFSGKNEDTYLKTYYPGESFGELALLYNAPRAASIQASTDAILFALDRETFNHIVKDAASKKREKYENFLMKVELLESLDPYERIKIADAVEELSFKQGQYVMKQGDMGDCFYFLEFGECSAMKQMQPNQQAIKVFEYKPGDYFGELALLKHQPRQASILCNTDVKVVKLSADSFQRLLGPLEDILKRNMKKYEKYM